MGEASSILNHLSTRIPMLTSRMLQQAEQRSKLSICLSLSDFFTFWTVIEELSRERATLCRDVRQGKVEVLKRDRFDIAIVPGPHKSYKPKTQIGFCSVFVHYSQHLIIFLH